MTNRFNLRNLNMFKEYAKTEFLVLNTGARLKGMDRPLSESELLALAYYRASLHLLNSLGALRPEWETAEDSVVFYPDSDVETEE